MLPQMFGCLEDRLDGLCVVIPTEGQNERMRCRPFPGIWLPKASPVAVLAVILSIAATERSTTRTSDALGSERG